ncbi:MAG: ribonuclease P protein component [Candidatus Kapabacteria bacterium]|nr:ribonuclease P protein component [Candidatus Kapabacteria bacterium]
MPDYKIRPLKGKAAFDSVFKGGKRFKNDSMHAVVRFDKEQQLPAVVLCGIVVRKKIAKTAVLRNRIKRLARESLFAVAKTQPELIAHIESMVVLWNTTPEHPRKIELEDVQAVVTDALQKAQEFYHNRLR